MEGTCLPQLIKLAVPICQAAEKSCPRTGPGRKPEIPDWAIAVLIAVAVLKQKKSKSSQFRYLHSHRKWFAEQLQIDRLPSRSTYFERYKKAWRLLEVAISKAGDMAIESGMVDARCVAADQSVIRARGPLWNQRHVQRGVVPRAADRDATWSRSAWHGWTLGYSYEVIVSAEKTGAVWPLLASADPASHKPNRTFPPKVERLHPSVRYLLADSGYDSTDLADLVELRPDQKRTGRRLLCPYPKHRRGQVSGKHKETKTRKARRLRRQQRFEFFQRPFAQRLIKRRGMKVEPFNDWLKTRFDLHDRVWHKGLDNNRTQLLAAILGTQILLMHNYKCGSKNGAVQWILDSL